MLFEFFYQSKTKLGNMYYVYGVNYEIELIFIDLRNGWQREKYSSLSLSLWFCKINKDFLI